MSENRSSGGSPGHCRPSNVISMMRHPISKLMAIARLSLTALLCCKFSMPQPLLRTRCQSSIRQRRQYQRRHSRACSSDAISMVGLLQNAPCGVSTPQKKPHLRAVNSGFSGSKSLPDTVSNSPTIQRNIPDDHAKNSSLR